MPKLLVRLIMLSLVMLAPVAAQAQSQAPTAAASDAPLLKPPELDALLAPIALYPDPLITNILMAATYPLEIVQAERWLNANKNLKADQLKEMVDKRESLMVVAFSILFAGIYAAFILGVTLGL